MRTLSWVWWSRWAIGLFVAYYITLFVPVTKDCRPLSGPLPQIASLSSNLLNLVYYVSGK
jgi:hypothetical protein